MFDPSESKKAMRLLKTSIGMILFVVVVVIANLTLLISINSERSFIRELPYISKELPMMTFCRIAMNTLLSNQIDKSLFDKSIAEQLDHEGYSYFDFEDETKISHVSYNEKKSYCKVLVKSECGFRLFYLNWIVSSDYQHFFRVKINHIKEEAIDRLEEVTQ